MGAQGSCTEKSEIMRGTLYPDKRFVIDLEVPSFQVDSNKKLKAVSFMDLAQEIAYHAATSLHFGYDDMIAHGAAWVLSRMHIRFINRPSWNDSISLQTWHRGASGPFFVRDFRLMDAKGQGCILATSSWVGLDVKERKLVKVEDFNLVQGDTTCPDSSMDTTAGKVVMPKDVEVRKGSVRKVNYSDIDLVGHTNNTRYILWALDEIGFDQLSSQEITEIKVNFNHETISGDEIQLLVAQKDNSWFIEGLTSDVQAFICKITF